jgi:hypothetical protein
VTCRSILGVFSSLSSLALTSFILIYSMLSSRDYPSTGYYTSLLSQYDQDEFGEEDNVEPENEVMEVTPMTRMNSESKSKGRSKNFSEEEDNLLVSAWLNVGQDAVDGNQQKMQLSGEELRNITMNTGHSTLTVIGRP